MRAAEDLNVAAARGPWRGKLGMMRAAKISSRTTTRGIVLLAGAAALSTPACGHHSRRAYAADHAEEAYATGEAQEPQVIYIYLAEPGAPPPEAAPQAPENPLVDNPFDAIRRWTGDYDCPQGTTDMKLTITGVRGRQVEGIFGFHHVPSGAAGSYFTHGTYDQATRTIVFHPGDWIERPPNYETVSVRGDVAADGSLFAGRIDHPRCGAFRLRPDPSRR